MWWKQSWVRDTVRRGLRLKTGFATTRLTREANWRSRKWPWLLQHSRIGGVDRLGKIRRSIQATSASLRSVLNPPSARPSAKWPAGYSKTSGSRPRYSGSTAAKTFGRLIKLFSGKHPGEPVLAP